MGISLDSMDASLHSVEIQDASGQALAIDASGYITSNINGTITVSATQLDIDDLSSAADNVEIKTAAGVALSIDASGYLTAKIDGTVAATQSGTWNIGSLASITADVSIDDGGNVISIDDAGGSITVDGTVSTIPGGYSTWKVSSETVTSTEGELVSTPLASRGSLLVQNLGSVDVYVKEATGVSTSNGMLIPKGSSYEVALDSAGNIFAITAAGSADLRVVEYAA